MKKIIIALTFFVGIFFLFLNVNVKGVASQETISSKLIRFHVLANSDSKEDQELKLKVRDSVLKYLQPKLNEAKNINDSRNILNENHEKIKEIAEQVIKENGYRYSVSNSISFENFPIKTYGNITLPPGKYEAYRIIIGNGGGQNWWCVMFPPLCFVDVAKGNIAEKQTETQMKRSLTNEEYEYINNNKEKNIEKNIKIKFKLVEILNKLKKSSN